MAGIMGKRESKPRKFDLDDTLNFGKHKGKTVEDVLESDPSYLLWCLENLDWFEVDNALQDAITRAC